MYLGAFLETVTAVLFVLAKLKMDAQQRRRAVLEFTVLADVVGPTLPPGLVIALGAMQRDRSVTRSDVDLAEEGVNVETRLYPEEVKPHLILAGAELKRFKLKRDEEGNKCRNASWMKRSGRATGWRSVRNGCGLSTPGCTRWRTPMECSR
jgi:hypothetical protein